MWIYRMVIQGTLSWQDDCLWIKRQTVLGCSSTMKIVSGVKEDEHKCVNCGNCKNQCPSGNVEIRKKLY